MRRNRVKKVMAVMLAAGMVSGLAACGGKTAEKPAATPAAKEAAADAFKAGADAEPGKDHRICEGTAWGQKPYAGF